MLAVIVVLVWLFGAGRRDEGDEEDQVTATTPSLSHSPSGNVIVTLSREQQANIGLRTEVLAPITRSREVTAYGVVLDPAPLAALDAQLVAARAALDASRAEYARAKLLHSEKQNVSLKDFQSAQAKFQSDQAQFNLLGQRLADEWGGVIAAMAPAERAELVGALIRRTTALIRVSVPAGESLASLPAQAEITVLGYSRSLATQSIWYAPSSRSESSRPGLHLARRGAGLSASSRSGDYGAPGIFRRRGARRPGAERRGGPNRRLRVGLRANRAHKVRTACGSDGRFSCRGMVCEGRFCRRGSSRGHRCAGAAIRRIQI